MASTEGDVAETVATAQAAGRQLAIRGGGSKATVGAPVEAEPLDLSGLAGVVDYDPMELVLTVRPGTPLAEVQELVAGERQMLAFDPFDHGELLGTAGGRATIGGVVAAGVAGSRRVSAGSARDYLLGFRAVSGRGETFVAGAKVVKNVTGYDLPKLAANSWGRLFALTELTLKVLPAPRATATRAVVGLNERQAVAAMAAAMGSPAEVAAAAHLPGAPALTLLRVEGFGPSVAARGAMLDTLLKPFGPVETLGETEAARYWDTLRTLAPLFADRPLWRINLPPSAAPALVEALRHHDAAWLLDWAGGLVWVASAVEATLIRQEAERGGGHATLVRASAAIRQAVPTFHPPAPGVAALEARVRRAFDPIGVFETGRF